MDNHKSNVILKTSSFPSIWKKSIICPILKKGDVRLIQNYRPISLLCNFAKVLETILYKRIYTSVKQSISPFQHGFMGKKSTTTNLTSFTQDVSETLNDNGQVDVIFTDFQKAFKLITSFY